MNVAHKNKIQKECILGVNSTIGCVELLNDHSVLYTCGNHVLIWSVHTKKQTFLHHCRPSQSLLSVTLCPSRKRIAVTVSTTDDSAPNVVLYCASTFRRKKAFRPQKDGGDVTGLSFSRGGERCVLLADDPNRTMEVWDVRGVPKRVAGMGPAPTDGGRIRKADVSPTDDDVVCVSGDGILWFFRLVDRVFRPITVDLGAGREVQDYPCRCWLPSGHVVLGTADGELIVVRRFKAEVVVKLEDWDEPITAMVAFSKGLIIGGGGGSLRVYLTSIEERNFLTFAKELGGTSTDRSEIASIATSPTEDILVCLMKDGRICSFPLSNLDVSMEGETAGENIVPRFHSPSADGTDQSICLDVCLWKPIVATGGGDQTLRIWNYDDRKFELVHDCKSDIISISLHPSSMQILICCKEHTRLDYIQRSTLSTVWHNEICTNGTSCFSNGGQYFALGIGPFVQVYETYSQDPICTLRGHSATLKAIAWKEQDEHLGTIGADGVICIWDIHTGCKLLRHMKVSHVYISGSFNRDFSSVLVNTSQTSTILHLSNQPPIDDEKDINQIASSSSIIVTRENTLDLADSSFGITLFSRENVIFGTITNEHRRGQIYIKSPSYEHTEGTFVKKTLHSRAISCVRLSPDQRYLFTGSLDGSLCIVTLHGDIISHQPVRNNVNELGHIVFQDILLSQSELEGKDAHIQSLQRQAEEMKCKNKIEMEEISYKHTDHVSKLTEDLQMKLESISQKCQEEEISLTEFKDEMKQKFSEEEERQSTKLAEMNRENEKKLQSGRLRIEQFDATCMDRKREWDEERKKMDEKNEQQLTATSKIFDDNIKIEMDREAKLIKEKEEIRKKHDCCVELIEEDVDMEIASETQVHELAIQNGRKVTQRLEEENDIMKKKYASSMKDYEEHKDTILSLEEKQAELTNCIEIIEKGIKEHDHIMHTQEKDILMLDHQINELTKDTYEMEKSRFMQSEQIQGMKKEMKPKEEVLQGAIGRSNRLETELLEANQKNANLRVMLLNLKLKLDSIDAELKTQSLQVKIKTEANISLERKMQDIRKLIGDKCELKRAVIAMYHEYMSNETKTCISKKPVGIKLEIDLLKKNIESTEGIIEREMKQHLSNMSRLKRENKILRMQIDELHCEAKSIQVKQMRVVDSITKIQIQQTTAPLAEPSNNISKV